MNDKTTQIFDPECETEIQENLLSNISLEKDSKKDSKKDFERQQLRELITNSDKFVEYLLEWDIKENKSNFQKDYCSMDASRLTGAYVVWRNKFKELLVQAKVAKATVLKDTKCTQKDIESSLTLFKPIMIDDFLEDWRIKYKHDVLIANDDNIKTWLWSLNDKYTLEDLAIMKHFLWQIKRNIYNMLVINPVMPIFYDKLGGIGKSWQITKLFKPLTFNNNMFIIPNLEMSTIENEHFSLMIGDKYICFFDEMSGIDKRMLEKLNSLITGQKQSGRIMYSQNVGNVDNKCSYIGSTNRPLKALISTKSQRRYYQIECQMDDEIRNDFEKLKEYWEGVNKLIDYDKMFQSIDETKEDGYLVGEEYKNIKEIQNENVNYNSTEIFLEEFCRNLCEEDNGKWFMASELFEKYSEWKKDKFPDEKTNIRVFGIHATTCPFAEKKRLNSGFYYKFDNTKLPKIKIYEDSINVISINSINKNAERVDRLLTKLKKSKNKIIPKEDILDEETQEQIIAEQFKHLDIFEED